MYASHLCSCRMAPLVVLVMAILTFEAESEGLLIIGVIITLVSLFGHGKYSCHFSLHPQLTMAQFCTVSLRFFFQITMLNLHVFPAWRFLSSVAETTN